ncbi:uncharacterized protein LOC128868882 [Anastrepha ludens]|uniref:uncharacterized protein LOC128868882 n=1 Tax=Anastrepha ludens TaxID=28586 RepID=UPI0023AFB096|nr:uncharacterized protein LOC128868882 [Anastrepha ludens]
MSAEAVANALLNGWISHYGVPRVITTDQGRQFESALFRQLSKILGFNTNGMIERFRTLKAANMCRNDASWSNSLPLIMLGLRASHKPDLNASPAELVYGTTLRLPGDFFEYSKEPEYSTEFVSGLRSTIEQLRPIASSNHANIKSYIQSGLANCTHVFLRDDSVRKSLKRPYDGPYKIIKRGDKTLGIDIRGRSVTVTTDRVKAACLDSNFINQTFPPSINRNQEAQPTITHKQNVQPLDLSYEKQPISNKNGDATHPMATKTTRAGRQIVRPQRLFLLYRDRFVTGGGVMWGIACNCMYALYNALIQQSQRVCWS